jgi:hypothetical protein
MSSTKTKGRKAALGVWMVFCVLLFIPVCFALSVGPAYWFSEHTANSRIVFFFPAGQPVWVSQKLYYFSKIMEYLTFSGIALLIFGFIWLCWNVLRRKRGA